MTTGHDPYNSSARIDTVEFVSPLERIIAEQARLYGRVTTQVWFARRIAEYERAGNSQLAQSTRDIAEKYGVDWRAGKREIEACLSV
jgi:hypothetical protein